MRSLLYCSKLSVILRCSGPLNSFSFSNVTLKVFLTWHTEIKAFTLLTTKTASFYTSAKFIWLNDTLSYNFILNMIFSNQYFSVGCWKQYCSLYNINHLTYFFFHFCVTSLITHVAKEIEQAKSCKTAYAISSLKTLKLNF